MRIYVGNLSYELSENELRHFNKKLIKAEIQTITLPNPLLEAQ